MAETEIKFWDLGEREMGKARSTELIYEQYAEAATALIMEQYTLALGDRLCREEGVADVPESLDLRCRKLIKKHMAKERAKTVGRGLMRITGVAAVFVLMLFGVAAILFATVEAIRVPVVNFFIEQKEGYMEITGTALKDGEPIPELDSTDALAGRLPEAYKIDFHEVYSTGGCTTMYSTADDNSVLFSRDPYFGIKAVDTENAIVEQVQIGPCEATLIFKGGYRLIWLDPAAAQTCYLEADAFSREEIISLAEQIYYAQ